MANILKEERKSEEHNMLNPLLEVSPSKPKLIPIQESYLLCECLYTRDSPSGLDASFHCHLKLVKRCSAVIKGNRTRSTQPTVFLGLELLFEMTHKGMVFIAEITRSIIKTCHALFVFTTKYALANLRDETSVLSRFRCAAQG